MWQKKRGRVAVAHGRMGEGLREWGGRLGPHLVQSVSSGHEKGFANILLRVSLEVGPADQAQKGKVSEKCLQKPFSQPAETDRIGLGELAVAAGERKKERIR